MTNVFGVARFTILNVILFQLLWFSCVVGVGANGWHWTAALTTIAISIAAFFSPVRRADYILACSALLLGLCIDSVWVALEILVYPNYQYVPYWIGVLWFGMGLTINHSLSWFRDRPVLGPLVVGLFAPITYLSGQRLDAVIIPDLTPLLVVSLSWMIIFYALSTLAVKVIRGAHHNQS